VLSWAMPWVLEKVSFISTRVNHILRVTKPNTKRATNICLNSLSQIGAYGLRYNSFHESFTDCIVGVASATPVRPRLDRRASL
jgi:hypothetical protein